jgi:Uma2 family endonuclease
MKSQRQPEFTLEEYYGIERASERRWEFWDGEIFCMSGGSKEHGLVISNISTWLARQMENDKCFVFSGDQALKVSTLTGYVYPDVVFACEPQYERHSSGIDLLTNPMIIVEVTSESSTLRDYSQKKTIYQAIDGLYAYLIIEPDAVLVTRYIRIDHRWDKAVFNDQTDYIDVFEDWALPINTVYRGIDK